MELLIHYSSKIHHLLDTLCQVSFGNFLLETGQKFLPESPFHEYKIPKIDEATLTLARTFCQHPHRHRTDHEIKCNCKIINDSSISHWTIISCAVGVAALSRMLILLNLVIASIINQNSPNRDSGILLRLLQMRHNFRSFSLSDIIIIFCKRNPTKSAYLY